MMRSRSLWTAALILASCGRPTQEAHSVRSIGEPAKAEVTFRERVIATTEMRRRADGTSTAVITAVPRAYRDVDGSWRSIVPVIDQEKDGSLIADQNSVRGRFPRTLAADKPVRLEDRATGLG